MHTKMLRHRPHTMLLNLIRLIVVCSMGLSLAGPAAVYAAPGAAGSARSDLSLEVGAPAHASLSTRVLPAWYDRHATGSRTAELRPAVFPSWYAPAAHEPRAQESSPVVRPLARSIPLADLTIDVTGPDVASAGAPAGKGEVYTAVVRNGSTRDIAYGLYLTATHPSFLAYDGGAELLSDTGTIEPLDVVTASTAITWTPATSYNLAAGEAITLNFRLRATCAAVSGQRLEVGVRYNADPPPADPVELNTGALNVTVGRGNLVINKTPALQNLSTDDFGKPITWTVEVQNTGLGKLYNAVITDTGGTNLSQPAGDLEPSVSIPVLEVNEVQTYTVVGSVESCNLTNVARAAWPCGNLEGDGTEANPVSSTVSVLFTPSVPKVSLETSADLEFPYCAPVSRTVTITATDAGGAAADLRIVSNLADQGFLRVVTDSVRGDWTYAEGEFAYVGGTPEGALGVGEGVTLTFQVEPETDVCNAGSGVVTFTPRYRDVCAREPFTGTGDGLAYRYAQDTAPALDVVKDGPAVVSSGEHFTYTVTLSGENPEAISGTMTVTDILPTEFALQGAVTPSVGTVNVEGQTITWQIDPSTEIDDPFSETLVYQVRAITEKDVCGAGLRVANQVEAFAEPTCPACDALAPTAVVETIIENQEGVSTSDRAFGDFEVCGSEGFTLVHRYEITGTQVVTWANAVFTEALGTPIGAGALGSSVPLEYRDALSVTVDGVDHTGDVTATVVPGGQLVIDLGGLEGSGAPTQNLTLGITYTVGISEASLGGAAEVTLYDWSQLYLPHSQSGEVCAGNDAFNQAIPLTIGRGDLAVGLEPQALDRCEANRAVIRVTDRAPGRLTDSIVITFTASGGEVATARNFTTTGGLPDIASIDVVTDPGNGRIVFTLPADYDATGSGTIAFDLDVACTGRAPWHADIAYESRCNLPHTDGAALTHTYRKPGLILFATPVEYTLRDREPTWRFFVANNGNLTATHVVVTNTAYSLQVVDFAADGPDVSAALPAATAIFTIGEIAPGVQRAVTVTGEAVSCESPRVDIAAQLDCFGTVCGLREETIPFNRPRPYLRTNNGQTADLPMCDLGEVVFTTKNASPDVSLYRLNITETLRQLTPAAGEPFTVTVFDAEENVVAATHAFTPAIDIDMVPGGITTTLAWQASSATDTAVVTWFEALPPLFTVRIQVPVRTSCVAPDAPQGFAAASAEEPCGARFARTENAVTFQTLEPNLNVVKDGRVGGGDWGEEIYATPGQTVTWRLRVTNPTDSRAYKAENVVLSDTWPIYFDVFTVTTSSIYTPVIRPLSRTVTWDVGDVALDKALTFYITGTVVTTDAAACSAATTNRTRVTYGCDNGCINGRSPFDTAQMDSRPALTVELAPDAFSVCEGEIPVILINDGARAYGTTLTLTLPSGYEAYAYTLGADAPVTDTVAGFPGPAPQFTWDEIPGRISEDARAFTMTVSVRSRGTTGICPEIDPTEITATLGYDDAAVCTDTSLYEQEVVETLDVGVPSLTVDKTPASQTADVGEPVTWTVTIANTGTAAATNVLITDTVGSAYSDIDATGGGTVVGDTVTWTLSALDVGATWTAEVSAHLNAVGGNRNVVTTTAFCDTGCASAVAADTARTTLLQDFVKAPELQTGTIGSLAAFTFTTTLPDADARYQNLTLTDTLPVGLGYVGSVLTYTADADGTSTTEISGTPTRVPSGPYPSGDVVWSLGDLSGTVQVNGVITAVIQNVPSNQAGDRLTNGLAMTYVDDGVPYTYADDADVDIREPNLQLAKRVATASGSQVELTGAERLTYTLVITSDGTGPAYDVLITDAVPSGISVTHQYTGGADATGGTVQGPDLLTWAFDTIPTDTVRVLSYTAVISEALPDRALTNVATTTWTSTPDDPVGEERTGEDGPGGSPDDYADRDDETIDTAPLTLQKAVEPERMRVGDPLTYTLVYTVPAGTMGLGGPASYLEDTLPPGVWAITDSERIEWAPAAVGPITFTDRSYGINDASQTVRWTFADAITSTQDTPTLIALTVRAQATGVDADGAAVWEDNEGVHAADNRAVLVHRGTQVDDDTAANEVVQPALAVGKTSVPPAGVFVARGETITYTLTLTNDGYGPAYDLVITDTLPVGVDYVNARYAPNPSGALVTETRAGRALTYTVDELGSGPNATMSITVVSRVTDTIGANLHLTNTARIPAYDSQPGDGPGPRDPAERTYADGDDAVVHRTVDAEIAKSVTPITATLGDVITYTLRVPESPISATLYTVTVTDTLSEGLQLHDVLTQGVAGDVTRAGNAFTVTYGSLVSMTQRLITVTAVLSDPLGADAGDVLTNVAVLRHRDGGPTFSEEPRVTVTEPSLDIDKSSDPPAGVPLEAGDTVTYTVRLTNATGATVSDAHDLVITDTLPVGMRSAAPAGVSLTVDGVSVTGYTDRYTAPDFTVTLPEVERLSPGSVLLLTYAVRVDDDVEAGVELVNRAAAAWSSRSGDVPGDRDYGPITDTTPLTTPQAVGLTKHGVPPTVTVGSTVVFTVTVPDPTVGAELRDVVVTDVVDSRLRIDAVDNGTFTGQTVTGSFPRILSYTQETLVITTTVRDLDTVTAGTPIANRASFDYATGTDPIDSDVVTTTVAEPDLGLSKTVQMPRNPVGAGDRVTYTLALTNRGTWTAYDLVITDSMPSGLDYEGPVDFTVTDPSDASTGGAYPAWTVDSLNVGGVVSITFTARVNPAIGARQTLTNAGWAAYDTWPGEPDDERDYEVPTDTVRFETGDPALDLTKRATPDRVRAGDCLTYTLSVTNTGIVSATNVIITDVVPSYSTFFAASGSYAGPDGDGVLTWTLGTLDVGVPQSVTLVVDVVSPLPNGTVLTNTGWVAGAETVTDTDEVTRTVESSHTLTLDKTADPEVVAAGGVLTYTLEWGVSGNERALGVTLSDTVPANTVFEACDGCDPAGDALTWDLGDRDPGERGAVTFTVRVDTPLITGTQITNAAVITDTQGITDTGDVVNTVESSHTLTLDKTADPEVVAAGGVLTYTLEWGVSGNERALGVTLSDTVPANTVFEACDGCDPAGDALTWDLGVRDPGERGVVTFTVTVAEPLPNGTVLENAAVITDTQGVTDTGDVTNTVESRHTLTITKRAAPDPVEAGDLLTYTLDWAVSGNERALGVTLSDTVPANTVFEACDGCDPGGDALTWDLGDRDPGERGAVTFTVRVDTPLITGTQITNVVAITDMQGISDTDDVATSVGSSHALSVSKSAVPTWAVAGERLTYTVDWSVRGNEPAYGVTLSDTLPSGTTFDSCGGAPCGVALGGGVVTWSLGAQLPPASGAVTVAVRVDPALPMGSVLRNRVAISDTRGLTDTDETETSVQASADLMITKVDTPDPVVPGRTLTYTLVYTNAGPSDATDVWIEDWLPNEVIFEGASPAPTYEPTPLVWAVDVPAGGGGTLVVTATVRSWVTETFTNGVSIFTETVIDPDPENNDDEEPTDPALPDLAISKTVTPVQAAPGQPLTYTIRVTNTGAVPFTRVVLTDTLPIEVHYVNGSGRPVDPDVVVEPLLIWRDLGPLDPTDAISVHFAVTAARGVSGTLVNAAQVAGDDGVGVVTDTDDVPVELTLPGVVLEKTLVGFDRDPIAPNFITFTLAVTNTGVTPLGLLPLTDAYDPYYLRFVRSAPIEPDRVDHDAGEIAWDDVTADVPHGFGRNLMPEAGFHITAVFSVVNAIEVTTNTMRLGDGRDIFENPTPPGEDAEAIVNVPTRVELAYLRAARVEAGVRIEWATTVEIDNFEFRILRAEGPTLAEAPTLALAQEIAVVPSQCGGNLCGETYGYLDEGVDPERTPWYWLVDVDTEGQKTVHGPVTLAQDPLGTDYRTYLPLVLKR